MIHHHLQKNASLLSIKSYMRTQYSSRSFIEYVAFDAVPINGFLPLFPQIWGRSTSDSHSLLDWSLKVPNESSVVWESNQSFRVRPLLATITCQEIMDYVPLIIFLSIDVQNNWKELLEWHSWQTRSLIFIWEIFSRWSETIHWMWRIQMFHYWCQLVWQQAIEKSYLQITMLLERTIDIIDSLFIWYQLLSICVCICMKQISTIKQVANRNDAMIMWCWKLVLNVSIYSKMKWDYERCSARDYSSGSWTSWLSSFLQTSLLIQSDHELVVFVNQYFFTWSLVSTGQT